MTAIAVMTLTVREKMVRTRRLKFRDLTIVAPDAGPDIDEWLQRTGGEISPLCSGRGGRAVFVTHAATSNVESLDHRRLFTHAFGVRSNTNDESALEESSLNIAADFLDGNRSLRGELLSLDRSLAELQGPLVILQNVTHSHIAAIADWLRSSAQPRRGPVVLIVSLPPKSHEMNRTGSIQMIRHSLRAIEEHININIFVTIFENDSEEDVRTLHDATIYSISWARILRASRLGELVLKTI